MPEDLPASIVPEVCVCGTLTGAECRIHHDGVGEVDVIPMPRGSGGAVNSYTPPYAKNPPSQDLTQRQRDLALVKRVDDKLKRKVTRIIDHALSGADIDDGVTAPPEGWSKTKFRVAQDARRPLRDRPYYLDLARSVKESYAKADSNAPTSPSINATNVNVYVDQRSYEVKDVSGDDND